MTKGKNTDSKRRIAAYLALGQVRIKKNELGSALEAFDVAIALCNPTATANEATNDTANAIDALKGRAYVLSKTGDDKEELKTLKKILSLAPLDEDAHYLISNCLCRMGRCEEALRSTYYAHVSAPNNIKYVNARIAILLKMGRNEEALLGYNKALELAPCNKETIDGRMALLKVLGRDSPHGKQVAEGYAIINKALAVKASEERKRLFKEETNILAMFEKVNGAKLNT